MSAIKGKTLFFTTSPRSPHKMIPEIDLLSKNFAGKIWKGNTQLQTDFMKLLKEQDFFEGSREATNNLDLMARDRITRAPKAYGFVELSPCIKLTTAGQALVDSSRNEEIFLRQLLKFQLPSAYHTQNPTAGEFWIKPFLEIFRLIFELEGGLKFDELHLFALQMTKYEDFDLIKNKILKYRRDKDENRRNQGNYRRFRNEYLFRELEVVYEEEIQRGDFQTREGRTTTKEEFLEKKGQNMRDYADACVRYLRATGMVEVSSIGKTLSIPDLKRKEVKFFLDNVSRDPEYVSVSNGLYTYDSANYISYLGNVDIPTLLTDDAAHLDEKLRLDYGIEVKPTDSLLQKKNALYEAIEIRKEEVIKKKVKELKTYTQYEEIQSMFDKIRIKDDDLYDVPLMLEWNTWRAMTMIDGGNIKANLKFDDMGNPMGTAGGSMPDIECDYDTFSVAVEVTMSTGTRQYEMEGEPVQRHLGKLKVNTNKPAYCFFIAPKINEGCIAQFYMLYHTNLKAYGGKSAIIPMDIITFKKMVEKAEQAQTKPNPSDIEKFCKKSIELAETASDESDWYNQITQYVNSWC